MGATYVLVIDVDRPATIEIGALGEREFAAGAYAYVGSAFGPGGFARENATGTSITSRPPGTTLDSAVTFPDADRECELAATLPGDPVAPFDASDCDCPAHLLAAPSLDDVLDAAREAGGVLDGSSASSMG